MIDALSEGDRGSAVAALLASVRGWFATSSFRNVGARLIELEVTGEFPTERLRMVYESDRCARRERHEAFWDLFSEIAYNAGALPFEEEGLHVAVLEDVLDI